MTFLSLTQVCSFFFFCKQINWAFFFLCLETNTWSEIQGATPPARANFAIDTGKQKIFIYGGKSDSGVYQDLWGFDAGNFALEKFFELM